MTDFECLVQRAICKVCDIEPERVQPDSALSALGVDSLATAEVLVEIEIALGRQLPMNVLRRLDEIDTVRAIAAELESFLSLSPSRPSP